MGTMTNSEDLAEMTLNAAFHQGLHCLLRPKSIFNIDVSVRVHLNQGCPQRIRWHFIRFCTVC